MSLLIKGVNMPKNCAECPCRSNTEWGDDYCQAILEEPDIEDSYSGRLDNCSLVAVPAPHGRLIDADRLIAVMKSTTAVSQSDYDLFNHIVGLIEHQPTVIEKESDNNGKR